MAGGDTYSRVIGWLKVVLPLLALCGLATLFLFARTINPAQNLPFSDVDIDELTQDQRIGRPTFSGVTGGGAAFSLSALQARPDPDSPGTITATDVTARIDLPGGPGIDITADSADVRNADRRAGLRGAVTLRTTDGYDLAARDLNIAYDTMHLWSDNEIAVTGPGLRLNAGRFDMTGDGTADAPYLLVFKDKVKLVYEPGKQGD